MADYNMQMDYSGLSVPKRKKPLVAQNKPQQESSGGATQQEKLAAASEALKLAGGAAGADSSSPAMGVGQGALSGAAIGMAFGGPVGAGVGAGVGAASGFIQARAAKKQRERDAQEGHYKRLAAIEEQKAQRMQNAMAQMAANMGASLRR